MVSPVGVIIDQCGGGGAQPVSPKVDAHYIGNFK